MKLSLASVGAALISCQEAEKLIVYCLARLFPDQRIESVEMLQQIEEQNRRKMLGQLIGELRKRIDVHGEFDRLLSDFLKHRNALVHDFGRITRHNPLTSEGSAEIKEFAIGTSVEAIKVMEIFVALIDAWMKQQGWHEKIRSMKPGLMDSKLLVELRKTLGPHFDKIVFEKPSWKG